MCTYCETLRQLRPELEKDLNDLNYIPDDDQKVNNLTELTLKITLINKIFKKILHCRIAMTIFKTHKILKYFKCFKCCPHV